MNQPVYTKDILRLAAALEPPHALSRVDGRSELRAPTCGSTIATEVMLDGGEVTGLSQRLSACAFGQASAALLAKAALGADRAKIADALTGLETWLGGGDLPNWPGIEALEPALPKGGRHGAILLPFRALLAAVEAAR